MAWFPAGATLQRLDVTGRSGPELNVMRHELSESVGMTSTMLVDADARRWLLGLRWDHSRAWRLQELAERAGLADVIVEPSPVALQRALDPAVTLVRRDTSPDHSWVALFEGGVPIAAAGVEPGDRISPGLGTSKGSGALLKADFEQPMHASDLSVAVAGLAADALDLGAQADELDLLLHAGDLPYPPVPCARPESSPAHRGCARGGGRRRRARRTAPSGRRAHADERCAGGDATALGDRTPPEHTARATVDRAAGPAARVVGSALSGRGRSVVAFEDRRALAEHRDRLAQWHQIAAVRALPTFSVVDRVECQLTGVFQLGA